MSLELLTENQLVGAGIHGLLEVRTGCTEKFLCPNSIYGKHEKEVARRFKDTCDTLLERAKLGMEVMIPPQFRDDFRELSIIGEENYVHRSHNLWSALQIFSLSSAAVSIALGLKHYFMQAAEQRQPDSLAPAAVGALLGVVGSVIFDYFKSRFDKKARSYVRRETNGFYAAGDEVWQGAFMKISRGMHDE